jgi:hypothetical protein
MRIEVEPDMLSRPRAAWFLKMCLLCGFFSIGVARAAGHSTSGEQGTRTPSVSTTASEQQSDAYKNLAARLIEAPTEAGRAALLQASGRSRKITAIPPL